MYNIPLNFAQEGKVYGFINIRNAIEALILIVIDAILIRFGPFEMKANVYISLIVFLPLVIFSIIGAHGFSLTEFLIIFFKFRRFRTVLKKPTSKDKIMREKMLIEKREKQKKALEKERKKEERNNKISRYDSMFSRKNKEEDDE